MAVCVCVYAACGEAPYRHAESVAAKQTVANDPTHYIRPGGRMYNVWGGDS